MARILVIDDSLVVRKILATSLSRNGFAVDCYENGGEALDALSIGSSNDPDLIILDSTLPGWDSFEVMRHLKSHPRLGSIAVLMLLPPQAGLLDHIKCRLAGAVDSIYKPFTTQQVIGKVTDNLPGAAPHERPRGGGSSFSSPPWSE